jgi:hypothetical protein
MKSESEVKRIYHQMLTNCPLSPERLDELEKEAIEGMISEDYYYGDTASATSLAEACAEIRRSRKATGEN